MNGIYNIAKYNMFVSGLKVLGNDIKAVLLNSSHSFNASHQYLSDIQANEISGAGYVAGGSSLANKSVTAGATTKFDADNVSWTGTILAVRHIVLYDDTTNELICSFDLTSDNGVSDGNFQISWNASGILTLTTS